MPKSWSHQPILTAIIMTVATIPLMMGPVCLPSLPNGNSDDVICTMEYVYGIHVTLKDTQTSQPIIGATLTLIDGPYSEIMMEDQSGMGTYSGAGERAGTYQLIIETDGYQNMSIEGIVVNEDECHVIPIQLNITMNPL